MAHHRTRSLLLFLPTLLTAPAVAQTVTTTLRAATPLTVTTTAAGSSQTQTLPAGALAVAGELVSGQGATVARTSWLSADSSSQATVFWQHRLDGNAAAGPHDIVIEWTATSAAPIAIEVEHTFTAPIGATVPLVAIDIGDDGSFESQQGTTFLQNFSGFTLTPQPLAVRVRFDGSSSIGSLTSNLRVRAVPQNDLQLLPFGGGCLTGTMVVRPSFQDTGVVALQALPPINAPSVLVLGLAPAPVVLPPLLGAPCLLLPRQDAFVPFLASPEIPVAIPAAARPVDVWLQRAGVFNGQLFCDDATRVRAF